MTSVLLPGVVCAEKAPEGWASVGETHVRKHLQKRGLGEDLEVSPVYSPTLRHWQLFAVHGHSDSVAAWHILVDGGGLVYDLSQLAGFEHTILSEVAEMERFRKRWRSLDPTDLAHFAAAVLAPREGLVVAELVARYEDTIRGARVNHPKLRRGGGGLVLTYWTEAGRALTRHRVVFGSRRVVTSSRTYTMKR